MGRSRGQKIKNLAKKTYGDRKITEQEADELFQKYAVGLSQQLRGEIIAGTIEKFLSELPNNVRTSLESGLRDLHGHSTFSRFRKRALVLLMTAYYNGSISEKAFDVEGLIKEIAAGVQKKNNIAEG
jgi:hypothetical protein